MAKPSAVKNPLANEFPVIVQRGEPKAVILDIKVFRKLQILVDNLLNRHPEPEDAVLSVSETLRHLLRVAEREAHTKSPANWRKRLRGL